VKDKRLKDKSGKSFEEILHNIPSSDFDGHTEFKNLSPKQRLEWLSHAVQFAYKYSKNRDKLFPKPDSK